MLFIAAELLLAFILGACVGSFVNCAAVRRTTHESVLTGRSHCPACNTPLGPLELIPLLSYLLQGGKCKHCGKVIAPRYPLSELAGGLAFALVVGANASAGFTPALALYVTHLLLLVSILLYASLVDLDSRTIPNACIIAAIVVRAAYIVLAGPVFGFIDAVEVTQFSLIGAFVIAVPLTIVVLVADRILGQDSMGGGDIKLFFVAGLYFGWRQCLFLIIAACIIGIGMALVSQQRERAASSHDSEDIPQASLRRRQVPFGPAIACACVLAAAFGPAIIGAYDALFL